MLIDTFAPDWQNFLNSQMSDSTDGKQVFLLIDGAFVPDFYRSVQKVLSDDAKLALLFDHLPGTSDKTRSVSPFLVAYSGTSATLECVLDKCSSWPMISAIETNETITDLAKRLSAWCIVANDGQRFNFRFPDTRRLAAIFDALSPLQRGSLAGPAVRWSYIGRDGKWHELPVSQTASNIAIRPTLDNDQFAAMVKDSEIDETIVLLQDRGPLPPQPHSSTYAIVRQALDIAVRAELDQHLHVDWCRHCLDKYINLSEADGVAAAQSWRAGSLSAD